MTHHFNGARIFSKLVDTKSQFLKTFQWQFDIYYFYLLDWMPHKIYSKRKWTRSLNRLNVNYWPVHPEITTNATTSIPDTYRIQTWKGNDITWYPKSLSQQQNQWYHWLGRVRVDFVRFSRERPKDTHKKTNKGPVLNHLHKTIITGWPETIKELPHPQ